jgi:hypothetical protein
MTTLIPKNIKGKENDLFESTHAETIEQAILIFQRAFRRMNDPFSWHEITGLPVRFLPSTDALNPRVNPIKVGNYFRIETPAPGSSKGEGFDWVKVDAVEDKRDSRSDVESFGMILRACSNPTNNSDDTAHFFSSMATSSFLIQRNHLIITASYHGRNEVPNTETDRLLDTVRNTFVALGAAAGMSEIVWSRLLKAFLEE